MLADFRWPSQASSISAGSISSEMYIEVNNESRWLQSDHIGPGIEDNMEKACCLEARLEICW